MDARTEYEQHLKLTTKARPVSPAHPFTTMNEIVAFIKMFVFALRIAFMKDQGIFIIREQKLTGEWRNMIAIHDAAEAFKAWDRLRNERKRLLDNGFAVTGARFAFKPVHVPGPARIVCNLEPAGKGERVFIQLSWINP